jgi:hypothetical protein
MPGPKAANFAADRTRRYDNRPLDRFRNATELVSVKPALSAISVTDRGLPFHRHYCGFAPAARSSS